MAHQGRVIAERYAPGFSAEMPLLGWSMAAVMNNFAGDGNGYIGNLDLEPEKAHIVSETFDWHAADRSWELKATPYYSRVSDCMIDRERLAAKVPCRWRSARAKA